MVLSEKDWQKYVNKLAAINEYAARQMTAYINAHGIEDTQALIKYAFGLTSKYGAAATALTVTMYNRIAEIQKANVPAALPAALPTYEEVAATVNGTLKTTHNVDAIGSSVGRLVKQSSADTMLQNAVRDGAWFAWIPSGDGCAFCEMIASNGWKRAGKKSLNGTHAEHIHPNCRCEYAVRFNESLEVEGYDPDALYDKLDSMDGATWHDKVNALRREEYAKNKDEINEQKREAYAKRQEAGE